MVTLNTGHIIGHDTESEYTNTDLPHAENVYEEEGERVQCCRKKKRQWLVKVRVTMVDKGGHTIGMTFPRAKEACIRGIH